ncbi:MAG: hypothetical protein M1379_15490 [Firmicutes bacterium]|nr:hypothetical protein [Bacillota bacterium]
MPKTNLMLLLEQLENAVETRPRIPIIDRVLVDCEEILDLIDKVRSSLPEEIHRAEWLVNERERMLKESQEESARMIKQAEEYAIKLVDEHELTNKAHSEAVRIIDEATATGADIVEEAKAKANAIVDEATVTAERIRGGAFSYSQNVFNSMMEDMARVQKTVERGRQNLQKYREGGQIKEVLDNGELNAS